MNAEDGGDPLLYGVTVLAVEEQDADFWEETTSNPEDFDGYTPVVIVIERRVEKETADDDNAYQQEPVVWSDAG